MRYAFVRPNPRETTDDRIYLATLDNEGKIIQAMEFGADSASAFYALFYEDQLCDAEVLKDGYATIQELGEPSDEESDPE